MATILRVKRRRNEDPVENIVVSCKKFKSEVENGRHEEKDVHSSLKFAGTVTSKEEVISKHIRDAIRKDKLQTEYKRHQPGGRQRSRQHKRESSKANRFNITSTYRALDLAALDKEKKDGTENQNSPLNSQGDVCELCIKECEKENVQNKNGKQSTEKIEKEPVMCDCGRKKSATSVENVEGVSRGLNSAGNGAEATEKVYRLYDIEVTQSNLPTFESLIQEAQNASFVTCNSEQMVHEQVPVEDREEDYVYDLFYTNNRDFNLQLLESSLTINCVNMDSHVNGHAGEEDHEVYEDEDDENEEDNWRNDYPEEDPRFFENGDVDYVYGNGFDDYQSFDYDDRGLVEWMSSRCNIEDDSDESSSDDAEEASFTGYEQYKQRVIKELKIDNA